MIKNEYSAVNIFANRTAGETLLPQNEELRGMAFLRSTQSSIARDCERELKTASRGTLGGLTMLH